MKRIFHLFIILTGIIYQAQAQQAGQGPKKVLLIQSEKMTGSSSNDVINVLKPVFSHENSLLSSDSARFNQAKNTFDAFGHVVITRPDGTTVSSDILNYNGNTKIAVLTDNVQLVDKDVTLTTDYLTYNMSSKVGTYTGGGKLVNAQNTLTSKNGFYFAESKDAYFRYNVEVLTPQAIIKCDTLKYNAGTKMAYFYGPTNIKSKTDKTNLYTENGDYDTQRDIAKFGKKNLYTDGSKSLRGDSLYYDKNSGYGRAVKNITFIDTAEDVLMKGNLGVYRKADESTLVTENAYVVLITKDSAKVDSVYMTSDTLFTKVIQMKNFKPIAQEELKQDTVLDDPTASAGGGADEVAPEALIETPKAAIGRPSPLETPVAANKEKNAEKEIKPARKEIKKVSVKTPAQTKVKPEETKISEIAEYTSIDPAPLVMEAEKEKPQNSGKKKSGDKETKRESPSTGLDSLRKSGSDSNIVDTTKKAGEISTELNKKEPGKLSKKERRKKRRELKEEKIRIENAAADTVKRSSGLSANTSIADTTKADTTKTPAIKKTSKADSIRAAHANDTTRVRYLNAYHNVKIFKSDFQAKADSAFFSYADSTIRCYRNPIMWAQGSQLSGDTIYLQLKNKKLDNLLLQNNGFMVNTEGDSTKFNQVKGKLITGYFKKNELHQIFVDGNAESNFFAKDDTSYTGMNHLLSSRLKITFENQAVTNISSLRKPDATFTPIFKLTPEISTLKGFLWKPEERPKSKEEIIPALAAKKKKTVKPAIKKTENKGTVAKQMKAANASSDAKKEISKVFTVPDSVKNNAGKVVPVKEAKGKENPKPPVQKKL